jgi:hypothetical protein
LQSKALWSHAHRVGTKESKAKAKIKLKQKNLKRDFRILTEIGNLLYKEKNKPAFAPGFSQRVKNIENDCKNTLFPLSLFARKGSFLNQKTYDYLNSVSPKILRGMTPSSTTLATAKVHKTLFNFISKYNESLPSIPRQSLSRYCWQSLPCGHGTKGWGQGQKEASIKTRNDVIYQYLKTFSIFNKRKNGIIIKYNQHIGYNFNSKNILSFAFALLPKITDLGKAKVRGVEPQTKKSLKTNKIITGPLLEKEIKINKVNTSIN